MFTGKNILLGVTGSIAAYKSAILVRLLVKAGANVKVVMTPAAKEFITPLTLSTLSKNPVYSEFVLGNQGEWVNHVELAMWADFVLIAPATADVIAKMANGICDNLLLAIYLSAPLNPPKGGNKKADVKSPLWGVGGLPVFVAPAMDMDMFRHPATKANLKQIKLYGNDVIPPDYGELASGLTGEGRMAEPQAIVSFLSDYFKKKILLSGKEALVTAGPTYEPIDAVRFIGNHSSGKMGFAVAEELAKQGAKVTLICGPNSLTLKNTSIKRVDVTTADEMYKECLKHIKKSDITVMAAAVADFQPLKQEKTKIKKEKGLAEIKLMPTRDILSEIGKIKNSGILVGFALETENELANAKKKLYNKNLDMIVLNSLNDKGSGFGYDTNKITIIDKKNTKRFDLMSKTAAAKEIVNEIIRKTT